MWFAVFPSVFDLADMESCEKAGCTGLANKAHLSGLQTLLPVVAATLSDMASTSVPSDSALAAEDDASQDKITPMGEWISDQLANGHTPISVLRGFGAVEISDDQFSDDDIRSRLQAFALLPAPCEVLRQRAEGLHAEPPMPFRVWLKERWVNGATADQIMRVLRLPTAQDSTLTDQERWEGLWKLASEEGAWKIIAHMALAKPLREAPIRKVRELVASVREVAELVLHSRQILVLTGAGISASCGIPTFRDKGGFYDSVAKEFGLSCPEEVNDINTFRKDSRPWFAAVRKIIPCSSTPRKPSPTHAFIKSLEERGKLLHLFTQNIDTLERVAGISKVTCCHGSFLSATCIKCGHHVEDGTEVNDAIAAGTVPHCGQCQQGIMKPDVVLFNEPMPSGVNDAIEEHTGNTDLLLVIGTSLNVSPCCLIPSLVGAGSEAKRILINEELVGREEDFEGFLQGPCDESVAELLKCMEALERSEALIEEVG